MGSFDGCGGGVDIKPQKNLRDGGYNSFFFQPGFQQSVGSIASRETTQKKNKRKLPIGEEILRIDEFFDLEVPTRHSASLSLSVCVCYISVQFLD